MLGPVSRSSFQPSGVAGWALGRRSFGGLSWRTAAAYAAAQVAGAVPGRCWPTSCSTCQPVQISTNDRVSAGTVSARSSPPPAWSLVIFALARTGRAALVAGGRRRLHRRRLLVHQLHRFANPAVTIGRMFSDTFAGIAPTSVPLFIAAQLVGAAVGVGLVLLLYPDAAAAADDVVVPHTTDSSPEGRDRRHDPRQPSVLFVCVHNAGRSQMAAGCCTHLAGGRVEVRSAGSEPADEINPAAVEAMAEDGIDIAGEHPKILTTDAVQASDVVITMGCGDACPVFPGKRYVDWDLEDPAGKGVETVRPIRDDIQGRVQGLVRELLPAED